MFEVNEERTATRKKTFLNSETEHKDSDEKEKIFEL
jgi:hypothetical protein